MSEFLKGWRRKAGCVTLGLACVFAMGWIRGLQYKDEIIFGQDKFRLIHSLTFSSNGLLWESSEQEHRIQVRLQWNATPISTSDGTEFGLNEMEWRRRFIGFDIGRHHSPFFKDLYKTFFCRIPYGFIVVPLALLSAYLLLSKSRQAKPESP